MKDTQYERVYTDIRKGWQASKEMTPIPSDRDFEDGVCMMDTINALKVFFDDDALKMILQVEHAENAVDLAGQV